MSFEKAEAFVNRLRENREFRSKVAGMADIKAVKAFLSSEGIEFTERELMDAMISCMNGLDEMMATCCPGMKK